MIMNTSTSGVKEQEKIWCLNKLTKYPTSVMYNSLDHLQKIIMFSCISQKAIAYLQQIVVEFYTRFECCWGKISRQLPIYNKYLATDSILYQQASQNPEIDLSTMVAQSQKSM